MKAEIYIAGKLFPTWTTVDIPFYPHVGDAITFPASIDKELCGRITRLGCMWEYADYVTETETGFELSFMDPECDDDESITFEVAWVTHDISSGQHIMKIGVAKKSALCIL